MTEPIQATWDGDCIRLRNLPADRDIQVRPSSASLVTGLPAMAGNLIQDGRDLCFVPRFAFVAGTAYTVQVGSVVAATLTRPRTERAAATEVADVYPTVAEVPRNLLRCYVRFTAPMGLGYAADHLRLVDDAGETIAGALLPADHELWDATRTRLTVLLDPGRIKRGLASYRQAGYALRSGTAFRLVVDREFRDAQGVPLRSAAERRYRVGGDERRRVDPNTWDVSVPLSSTREPLSLGFDRPLDHGLLNRCLQVTGPDGMIVAGTVETGLDQRSWLLTPQRTWRPGPHHLIVDPVLEDLAGNSVIRVFDRDLGRADDNPGTAECVSVPFCPAT